jgi:membrane associated rhomboid family serine protease
MILLVPVSPEVPKRHARQIWPGLVLVIILCVGFLEISATLDADSQFVDDLYAVAAHPVRGEIQLPPKAQPYMALRPLLKIAPSKADWDFKRILYANFIHGSQVHLFLNLIGAFAGARICAVFIPFSLTFCFFLVGGSIGILASVLLSSSLSPYIPHVGASGGIFALMGTYYIYNFKFRTKYFFWFPSRKLGMINLKTSWFFFLDVLLLELVLSASQFLPGRGDNVDHVAHVFGFGAGMLLATTVRALQKWPAFLQTRGEFLYWKKLAAPKNFDPIVTPFNRWIELLEINPYNDQLKLKLYRHLYNRCDKINEEQLNKAFAFISPTFIRLHSPDVAVFIREVLSKSRQIPKDWLVKTPYDTIIRLAQQMTHPPDEQHLLYKLVVEYRKAQPSNSGNDRKLELLMRKLQELMPGTGADDSSYSQISTKSTTKPIPDAPPKGFKTLNETTPNPGATTPSKPAPSPTTKSKSKKAS